MGIGRKVMWGLAAATASKVARRGTRSAMHTDYGSVRLPRRVRAKNGLGTVLMFAVGTGVVLALADVLKEQKQIVKQRNV